MEKFRGIFKTQVFERIFENSIHFLLLFRNIKNVVVKKLSAESDFVIVLRIPPGLKTPDAGCRMSAAVIGLRVEHERELV